MSEKKTHKLKAKDPTPTKIWVGKRTTCSPWSDKLAPPLTTTTRTVLGPGVFASGKNIIMVISFLGVLSEGSTMNFLNTLTARYGRKNTLKLYS